MYGHTMSINFLTFMSDEGDRARVVKNLTDISDEYDLLPKGVAP
jgi:hypothetical protein